MSIYKKTLALTLLIALFWAPVITTADYIPKDIVLTPRQAIVKAAIEFAAPEKELMAVASCESSLNPSAKGDHGLANNIFQYHRDTFEHFASLMGEKLDYNSYVDQSRVTAFIWANYPKYKTSWTCWSKIK